MGSLGPEGLAGEMLASLTACTVFAFGAGEKCLRLLWLRGAFAQLSVNFANGR